jgi:hypothetical protein
MRRPGRGHHREHHNTDGTPKYGFPTRRAAIAARKGSSVSHVKVYRCSDRACRLWHLGRNPERRR